LPFTDAERRELNKSLDAYNAGDLAEALEMFPGYSNPRRRRAMPRVSITPRCF
jgi:hypothetical protein